VPDSLLFYPNITKDFSGHHRHMIGISLFR